MKTRDILNNQKFERDEDQYKAVGDYGMAASATREASDIGAEVLRKGGTAADAIVAMQFALAVSEPFNTGVGASGFIIYHHKDSGETKVFNGHSKAPESAHPEMCKDKNGKLIPFVERTMNESFVGIPGIMKALDTINKMYGTKELGELIEPSIDLAENGIRVNSLWDTALKLYGDRVGDTAKDLFFPNGVPLVEGDIVRNKALAKTFRIFKEEGIDALYKGRIGQAVIDRLQSHNGHMEKSDLENYECEIQEPVIRNYRGFDVAVPAPPNGGGTNVLQILKIIEKFDLSNYTASSWEKYFILSEAMRLVFSDKLAYMSDPNFHNVPVNGLLDPDYIAERADMIDLGGRNPDIDFGNPWEYDKSEMKPGAVSQKRTEGKETTHFTAVDRWGNVAACTSSLEHYFGAGIMIEEYGFLLNNDLTDFKVEKNHINEMRGGKYPVSAKCPTIILKDGEPFMTLGSPGGPTIVSSVAHVILNVIDFHLDLKEAIEHPRIYNSTAPEVWVEDDFDEGVKEKLKTLGIEILDDSMPIGNVQAILIDKENNRFYGAADSTRPGKATAVWKDEADKLV
ncbi:gamma-glutamyltransferase [Bacillus salacetis]|uniref:Glutathione hydrolase proenzyme n=1 Tax=Bacillus salacetis TaxID=2315464 RepID=A0A3A1R7S9_9BACI|nr:gamma-glutamyltransferase [Bacillus salacetis]RIW38527.1 gamma-glutamyltransferase [Bacillus salacetis]